jgi:hypothetical protein
MVHAAKVRAWRGVTGRVEVNKGKIREGRRTCCRRNVVVNTSSELEGCEILCAVEDGHDCDDELPGGQPSRALGEIWWVLAGSGGVTLNAQELRLKGMVLTCV